MPTRASRPSAYAFRCTSSYLIERHSRSMKMLSMKRPRPSIEIATPVAASLPAKASAVNVEPWTPFGLSSGDSHGVDLRAALSDEGEDLSSKVTLQGSNGVKFGMPFCDPTSNVVLGSLVGP